MSGKYLGELRTQVIHLKSGNVLTTDAPIDNKGKGEAFSPTDTLCVALASCMITIAGIAAETHGFSLEGTTWDIEKIMGTDPRRVVEIRIKFKFPQNANYSDKERKIIEQSMLNCPVAKSLHPDLKQIIEFIY